MRYLGSLVAPIFPSFYTTSDYILMTLYCYQVFSSSNRSFLMFLLGFYSLV